MQYIDLKLNTANFYMQVKQKICTYLFIDPIHFRWKREGNIISQVQICKPDIYRGSPLSKIIKKMVWHNLLSGLLFWCGLITNIVHAVLLYTVVFIPIDFFHCGLFPLRSFSRQIAAAVLTHFYQSMFCFVKSRQDPGCDDLTCYY